MCVRCSSMSSNLLAVTPPLAATAPIVPPQPARHTTPPCCDAPYDGQSKMLHSILNYGPHMASNSHYGGSSNGGSSGHTSPVPNIPTAGAQYSNQNLSQHHLMHHSSSSSTLSNGHHQEQGASRLINSNNQPLRPRSASVASLGSTGSSLRDSYSPSHDSTSPDGSLSRASPASLTSSPSPSPPVAPATPSHESSKLFNLLKAGTVPQGYASIYNSVPRVHTPNRVPSRNGTPIPAAMGYSPSSALKRPASASDPSDEQPIDLSCKPKKARSENTTIHQLPPISPLSSSFSSYNTSPSIVMGDNQSNQEDEDEDDGGSILKRILSANRQNSSSRLHPSNHPTLHQSPLLLSSLTRASPAPVEEPKSPMNPPTVPCHRRRSSTSSISSTTSSRCLSSTSQSRVVLAKKMLYPVMARVSDWMIKVVQFAKTQPEFSGLPGSKDKLTLLTQSWARILLLFMAETNFEFAVTPIHGVDEEENGQGWSAECPTMQSVSNIQCFIKKCQNLNLDAQEYHYMRLGVLFYKDSPSRIEHADYVDRVNRWSQEAMKDYVAEAKPNDKMRYSHLLLTLHTLYGINCKMVENLFCKHIVGGSAVKDTAGSDAAEQSASQSQDGSGGVTGLLVDLLEAASEVEERRCKSH